MQTSFCVPTKVLLHCSSPKERRLCEKRRFKSNFCLFQQNAFKSLSLFREVARPLLSNVVVVAEFISNFETTLKLGSEAGYSNC